MKWWLLTAALLGAFTTHAAVIQITPDDSFAKIESAKPGDEVVVAPGTYKFRLYFTNKASNEKPITIRAKDPANRPVWDMADSLVEEAPGSYRGGDRGRGAWQFSGATGYRISGIIFRNSHNAAKSAAGIRYYNGSRNIRVRDCLFELNDNGLTGGTQNSEMTVEFCEFDRNGTKGAKSPTHNLYILSGEFRLRFSYLHDSVQGQNFHIRAQRSVIEYNWFARANSYEGDLMTDDGYTGKGSHEQTMLLRGNVFLQKDKPLNRAHMFVLFNDYGKPKLTLSLRAINNTVVGSGGNAAFVRLSNQRPGTIMNAELLNNIISGTTRAAATIRTNDAAIKGRNNWLRTGCKPGPLEETIFSATPGFRDAANFDFRLTTDSSCVGAAAMDRERPQFEFFQGDNAACMFRPRLTAKDLGAFESTTSGRGLRSQEIFSIP